MTTIDNFEHGEWITDETTAAYVTATIHSLRPGETVSLHLRAGDQKPSIERLACTVTREPLPCTPADVIYGWAAVLVLSAFLWAYVVTQQSRRRKP